MSNNHVANKSAAIRAILKRARSPIPYDRFHEAVERATKCVIGRQRLKRLIGVMRCTTDPQITVTGRGQSLAYGWKAR